MSRQASIVVPGALGVISFRGLTFLLCFISWYVPTAGDARRPKPAFGSDNRTTLTICWPYLILETERRFLHVFTLGSALFGATDDDDAPVPSCSASSVACLTMPSTSDLSDFPTHGKGAERKFSSCGRKRTWVNGLSSPNSSSRIVSRNRKE